MQKYYQYLHTNTIQHKQCVHACTILLVCKTTKKTNNKQKKFCVFFCFNSQLINAFLMVTTHWKRFSLYIQSLFNPYLSKLFIIFIVFFYFVNSISNHTNSIANQCVFMYFWHLSQTRMSSLRLKIKKYTHTRTKRHT